MKLYGTYPSHFTRKVRLLLNELKISYEFIVLDKLLETGPTHFARNPLHMFPVLEDGETWLIESDVIASYIVEKYGKNTIFSEILPPGEARFPALNRLSIINGGMEAGVHRIRATRSGIEDLDRFAFFRQEKAAIAAALDWLNADLGDQNSYSDRGFCYLDICLISFLEWLQFREFLRDLSAYPNLARFVKVHASRPSVAQTHPSIGVG